MSVSDVVDIMGVVIFGVVITCEGVVMRICLLFDRASIQMAGSQKLGGHAILKHFLCSSTLIDLSIDVHRSPQLYF